MTERNGQLAGIIPAEDPTTARRAMDERPTAECEMSLDDANSPVTSHALTASSSVALSSSEEKERPFADSGNITRPSSSASNVPEQPSPPLSRTQCDYWRKALAGAPALLDLPTDRSRASHQSTNVSKIPIQLDASLTQSLKKVATEYDMDLGMVVMTGWGAVLARLSSQDDIVVGYHNGLGGLRSDEQTYNDILLLRLDLSGEPSTSQLLERVQKVASYSTDHQEFPSDSIAEIACPPLFQVALRWNNQAPLHSPAPLHVDLELQLQELDNEVVGDMLFSSNLFNPDTIKRHVGYLCSMLQAMAADVNRPIMSVNLLSQAEHNLVLGKWNDMRHDYPTHLCIHNLFEQQVERTPQATALVFNGQSLTYVELNERANRLAHHLILLGVQPESLVAICVERSLEMIIGLLAILKAGGAYIPLDPTYASDRLRDILAGASPSILVADKPGMQILGAEAVSSLTVVNPDTVPDTDNKEKRHSGVAPNPEIAGLTSSHLAYVIFTSGSTGKPKGVMVEHHGVVNLVMSRPDAYGTTPTGNVALFPSFSFDSSIVDIFTTLSFGGSLHVLSDDIKMDRIKLWEYLEHHSITQTLLPPAILQECKDLPPLKIPLVLVIAGEVLPATLVRALHGLIPNGRLVNDYGPTETTVSATTWKCPPDFKGDLVPIGRPIANKKIYILDKDNQPVPLGAVGEIYIGGSGVARGYLNHPELTHKMFLPDPFSREKYARMYKTGDLGRYLPDGNIISLGRNDRQVKIRGFRVELGEIEARLIDHPLVQSAAVIAMGEGSGKKLVAYVASKCDSQLVHTLRLHLTSCLPEYMVPAAIVRLDSLPINSNGKLDRKSLPIPNSDAYALQDYEEPQGETEATVARVWAELLNLDRVGRNDDFFALGGHSLLAARMLNRLRQLGLATSVNTVYRYPTISDLAQTLEQHRSETIPPNLITPETTELTPEMLPLINLCQSEIDHIVEQTPGGVANIQDIYFLSLLQDGMLYHHLVTTEGDLYLLISQMKFETRNLLDRYLEAFQEVVNRHDILRTAFVWKNISTPVQVVWRQAPLSVQELPLDPSDGPIEKQLEERFHHTHYKIDLTQAPLVRLIVAQDTDGRWVLLQLIHHIIGDHVAAEIRNYEIEQILHGQGHNLPEPYPFRNAIAQARSKGDHEIHRPFFEEMLGDIDEPTFPYGMVEVQNNGANITESHSILSQELNSRLRFQAKQMGVSLASLCHVAWSLVLARTSGQERVVFGTVLFGGAQNDQEVGPTMGIFINTLPFRCDINSQSVQECVHLAHIRLAALLEHEHASLALAQKCSGVPAGTPLFSALLNYLHTSLPRRNSEKLDMEFTSEEEQVHYPGIEFLGGRERTNYPFGINVLDYGTDLGLAVQTQQPIDSRRVESYMEQALESLVHALENDPDVAVASLEIQPPDERELLIHGFNTTRQDYPADLCIQHLFEQQVKRTPHATALVFNGQSVTYTELNARANKLAHHLIELGVQPDSLVVICAERSFDIIIGVIAVLKSGGAYVPLDPSYPKERLGYILEDAAPTIALVDSMGRTTLIEASLHHQKDTASMTMIELDVPLSAPVEDPKALGLTSRHLAYIVYTSGSTGQPKGVMVEHQGVVNYILSRIHAFELDTNSRVLQFASLSFDMSLIDIFTALHSGASLHLLEDRVRLDRQALWGYIQEHSITQAVLPPAILQECKNCPPLSMRLTLISAGEELPVTLLRTLQSLIPNGCIINEYGPTETTIVTTSWKSTRNFSGDIVPVGRPIANKRTYILDRNRRPVPRGAIGELYIGGVGVARGYLNRPALTSKAFLPDPFANDKKARMYKTGDLARYLPDGNIIFLGRNDHQVKIRGFRIELGEIETQLVGHSLVDKAAVITIGEGSDKKLVGYVVAKPDGNLLKSLRSHLTTCLPEYMVPAAIVRLDSMPLNSNGKLDRKALPVPNSGAFARQIYEAPQGSTETAVARIWAELLHLDRVSRNDNFFALGGHSLLAVQMIERLRRIGHSLAVSTLFKTPTISALVQSLDVHETSEAPTNLIMPHTTTITPEMLPLITLSQEDIDHIVRSVPGGVSNIQDIYALSPLQEGILFHHLLATEGDPYLLISFMSFETRELLDKYLEAIQMVVDRHDILRTAILHENLSVPAQVVWRQASLSVDELKLDSSNGPILDQLKKRLDPQKYRIDITQAPLLGFTVARDAGGQWILAQLLHHLISDHSTLETLFTEINAFMDDQGHTLPLPQPFRNLIAQAKSSQRQDDHERFFKEMLQDIDTPSLPFGLKDVHGQGDNATTSYKSLPQDLNDRLRRQAKQLGVSVASLCHLAWAVVISHTSGGDRVVFGTVLFGRMDSGQGSDSAMGLFINTLPLRIDLTGTVHESVLQTHERLASLLDHEHAPLALAQRCSNVSQGTPLFSAMLNYRHNATPSDVTALTEGIELLESHERNNYPFTLSVEDFGVSLGLTAIVVQPLCPTRVCEYMEQALESLVSALDRAPDVIAHELNILPENERELLLREWNATQQDYPADLCIHHLFEQQVERTPHAAALVFNGQSMTYTELNERVNRLAHHLIGLDVHPDSLVAICVERSIAMIVGVLAILKAGGAYVPLDPAYASERLRDILVDASPNIVIADVSGRLILGDSVSSMTVVDPEEQQDTDQRAERNHVKARSVCNPLVPGLTSSNLAYIIYTSGSTGKPKGVMIEHQGVVNLIHGRPESFGISTSSRALLFTSLSFDHSVSEIFSALTAGACLHLVEDEIRLDRLRLWNYFEQHSISHTSITPTLLQDSKDLPPLSTSLTFVVMGEALPSSLIPQVQKVVPNGEIINDYGPTEITVATTTWKCPHNFNGDIVSIGRPIPNKTTYILDKNQRLVPIGAIGELYIGGVGVARGYLNRPELTAKVFLQDPFSENKDARMYKTGDLARYLPDGNIIFLGRNDHQVKIRGFRIELGEIEARLVDHPLVDKAAVTTIGEGSDKRLVGYVVAKPDDNLLNTLRAYLTSCLPDYMVPAAIVRLDSLPINSNGKLDHKALPVPNSDAFSRGTYEEPRGDVEIAVAHIWAEVLNLDRVSRNDNFFALGGHSLLAVRLMNRVASLGIQMPLSTVFASPTLSLFVESISRCMDKESTTYSTIHPVSREENLALSFSQQRMWFLAQINGISETYHITMVVRLHGDLNRDAWQRALDTLFARHEALRSVFVVVDGQPQVRLLPAQPGLPIRWEDLRGSSDAESELEKMSANEATTPFNLAQGPLIRALMIQLNTDEHVFMFTQHHIVSDGWSSAIFNRELSTLYSTYCSGESDPLPPLSIQYPDYAAWQKQWLSGDRLETLTTYWKTALTDAPVLLDLPTDRPRPPQQSYTGDNIPIHLGSDLTSALKQLCQEYGVTLYMAILAAWSCVLSRLSGQDDIVIGSPSANRNHHQIEPLIGLFVNTLALRINLSGDPTVRQLLERVRKTSLDAQNHQDLPFEQVVDIVQPPRSLSHSPLFQVMFVLQNDETSELELSGLEVADAKAGHNIAKFDLDLGLYESDDEIVGELSYSTALFDRTTVERHVGYLCVMLQAMVVDTDQSAMSVNLLSQTESDLILEKWNETRQDYPANLCIHHLFEQQVARTPQATALVSNDQSLTYAELNDRANRLAHHLIALAVQPENLVAVCVERSFTMIVGVLGILKAGGAYVPLDPAYASNRLRDILADAAPRIVIADETGRKVLGESVLSSLTVVDPDFVIALDKSKSCLTPNPQVQDLTASNIAYVIFTSGSTGKPKGVMIEHRGVVNLAQTHTEFCGIQQDSRVLSWASLSFDASVWDIVLPLSSGASLYLIPDLIRQDRDTVWVYMAKHSITHASFTPSFLQDGKNLPTRITPLTLVLGGEPLGPTLLQSLIAQGYTVINDFGPTELTVSATTWRCPPDFKGDIVPIGRPVIHSRLYLLDKHGQPVPLGAIGEMYVGGIGVARGYLNRPELTANVFLPDPFAGDTAARMYKTGDLARYLPDGNLVYLGRNDHQVKIRGFRIELGEIESRLIDHTLVDEAAVVAIGEGSDKRLVGYVVAKPQENMLGTLRSYLTSCLPEYMVPAAIVRLDSLPINSNGKLDRKALPIPDSGALAREVYEEPRGDVETAIAHIWAEVLNLDRVGRNDNFFALGGHSLLAVRLMNRVVSLGPQMPLSTIFASPTLSTFAESVGRCMDRDSATYSTIHPIPRDSNLPLSFSQQRMWFLAQMEGVSETYHMSMAVRLHGDLNRDAWQRALDTLFARHESLRSVFVSINGQPHVRLLPAQSGMPIRWVDLRGLSDTESQLERISTKEAKDPFDLAKGPLIRVLMVQLESNEYVFMVTQHHIVSDGWSSAIFIRELNTLYSAYCDDKSDPLPPLSIQYSDYAAWQRQWLSGNRLETHITYWKTTLTEAPVLLDLPTDRQRPLQQSFTGGKVSIHLDSDLINSLRRLCQDHGVTLYMTILAAWSCVLSRMSGQDDIVIGSPSANRNHHQIESLIGFFVNTLALRVDLSGDPTVRQLLGRVRKASLDAQNHQDLPFEQVVDIVQPPRSLSHSPLFQVMFVLQNNEESEWHLPGLDVVEIDSSYDIAKFDLTLALFESDNEILGALSYSTALFDRTTVERHVGYLSSMLQAMVGDVDRPVMSVDLLSQVERDVVLVKWNDTRQDYPDNLCIHHLFEQQVERTPQATALVFENQSMTYAELNGRSNTLAHHLIELGVRPDSLVAICVERPLAMIVGILAILKAGGAYVPLDSSYASGRLCDILMDADPNILIADRYGQQALRDGILSSMTVVDPIIMEAYCDSKSIRVEDSLANPRVPGLMSRHMAYVIYTSGSTGKPKGVMVEHQGLVNLIMTRHDVFEIRASIRVLQFFSFAFDGCVVNIFTALGYGGSLHLLPDSIRMDIPRLWDYLEKESITQAILTPSVLQNCKDLPQLSIPLTLIVAGEALTTTLLKAIHRLIPNSRIVNDYGPTEVTVSAIAWKCPRYFDGDVAPIGRPIANKQVYILDEHRRPVPSGAIGELYIGGVGVARGYLNRPELTAKLFLQDPFSENKDARMYKTGDLARYLPDGNIIFLGRNDHQVKIRGFRIELGEIEARLVGHPLVDKAAVTTIGEGSDKRLVGYVVAKPDDNLLNTLRSHLTSCLPDYMVPAAIVRLDSLPINSNGKLDRKALPLPDNDAFCHQIYEKPRGDIETSIAHIWAEVLNIDRVSRNDNFFALGGHSLLAVRLMNRVASLGIQMPLSTVFASPTLSSFAECMDQESTTYSTIHPVSREGDLALSFSQQRMWFLSQMEGVSETYHIPMNVRLQGDLNRDAWQRALDTLFARHEALRSVFVVVDGQPQVRLLPAQPGLPIRWEDLRGSSDAESELEKMSANEATTPFNLAQGPLIRALMIQLNTDEHVSMFTQHHVVSDGWSSAIFSRELSTLYNAYCNGESNPLAPLSIQYPDYAAWQKQWLSGDRLETHTSYWKTALTDAPVLLDLPTDRPRPPQQSYTGDNIPIHLGSDLTSALKQLCQEYGVTLYMAILAAWSCVLSRLSGQDDIVIGSPSANRNHHQIEPLIGLFVNTLALRINLSGDPTVRQLLERVRKTSLDAQNHQDLPFEQVVDIVQPPRNLSHSPLFQVMLVLQNNESSEWQFTGIDVTETASSNDIAKFDLTLSLFESNNEILGSLSYSTALFDRTTVERHVGYLHSMLQAMAEDVDRRVMSVDLLSQVERELVLGAWNNTRKDYPDQLCIHHLFEKQVEHTPQATALVFNDQSLTYAELNERANTLAHHLIELGVQPDACVAVCVNRSLALIVGILAVLKAGGAYVPLDPTNPKDRLESILGDSRPTIMLVDTNGCLMLRDTGVLSSDQKEIARTVMVDPNDILSTHNTNPSVPSLTSRHLAYIIYTSGSTGKPKGVMIEHQGVVSRLQEHNQDTSSRFLQFTPLSFDVSVLDIFTTLCSGASLHLLQDDARRDLSQIWNYLQENQITHTSLTPTVLQDIKELSPLRVPLSLTFVGEILPPALPHSLRQLLSEGSRIVNEYGPTEATVAAIRWNYNPSFGGDLLPIGRPIANVRIYILDSHKLPVPLGAIGELYIGGVGVARGYLNRPELTSSVFLPDPFVGDKDARMYKTGDMGRYLPDGNIIFLGRNDHQVKIRGFRVELGEIEARLLDHPLVQSAAVMAMGDRSEKRLVAYVVAEHDDELVYTLRSHLTSCLPDYMVPAAFVRLDGFLLSSNGKLDRRRLPQPDNDAMAYQRYEPPRGEMENALVTIWINILNIDKIGRHDNFFMLGGHSLLAVRMISQVQSLMGYRITLGTLFMAPTIAELVPHMLTSGNTQEDAFDVLLPIRPRGTRHPLFCIHHGVGLSWSYIGLTRYLHPDQPIYGLQARGFFEGGQSATTLEDMVLDYMEQIRRIQPHGPYCLLGYSFGGVVVHTMAAHLESQGERVALLAVMDTVPWNSTTKSQAAMTEEQKSEAHEEIDPIQWFTNRVKSSLPDRARSYLERLPQVVRQLDKLSRSHTSPRCKSGMVLFRAMVEKDPSRRPISPDVWRPHVMGEIDVFDIDCEHNFMDQPAPMAEIGGVLAQRLNEIHATEAKEL
ncbi:MAG: Non-ribosomal peptide synthetase module [Benniella sp.]|nr:MAG: Non-ribosomal peptide synthetase module [Benniella sp.]